MSQMINVDFINLDNPEIGFNGKVKSEGFQESISKKKAMVLHMHFGNQMIITPQMHEKFTFIVLGKEEMQRREDATKAAKGG